MKKCDKCDGVIRDREWWSREPHEDPDHPYVCEGCGGGDDGCACKTCICNIYDGVNPKEVAKRKRAVLGTQEYERLFGKCPGILHRDKV